MYPGLPAPVARAYTFRPLCFIITAPNSKFVERVLGFLESVLSMPTNQNEGDIEIYSHDSSNNKIVFTKQSDGVTYIGTFYNYNIDTEAKNSGDLNNGYDLIIKTTNQTDHSRSLPQLVW